MADYTVSKLEAGEQIPYTLFIYSSLDDLTKNLDDILTRYGSVEISRRD